jgi:nucleotide-binding universal stress UspA family protein
MRHILAASDLSEPSDVALDRAIGLAQHLDAQLTIVVVDAPLVIAELGADPNPIALGEFERTMNTYVDDQLAIRVERVRASGVVADSVRHRGRPDDAIVELAESLDAALVVVGGVGRTGVKRLVLGSVAERVAHRSPRPVLIARSSGAGQFAKILVATDFEPPAIHALAVAQTLAAPNAAVEALHAWHYPAGGLGLAALGDRSHAMSALRDALTQGPQSRGDALAAAETTAGRPTTFALRHGPAAEIVVDEATAGGFDLIAVGTYGGGGVRRLLLGSVASQIIRHATCSVLVTHA